VRIGQAFPSKWMRADDLPDGEMVKHVIDSVTRENVGSNADDMKPVVWFIGQEKGLVLNKTNAGVISAAYGDETDDWHGKPVLLYSAEVAFKAEMVMSIRVKVPKGDVRGTTNNGGPARQQPADRRQAAPARRQTAPTADQGGGGFSEDDVPSMKGDDPPF
jgi:hypothetical protein